MGYNTVVLVLNDFMHHLEKAPHALAFAICHPPDNDRSLEKYWWPQIESVARDYGEDIRNFRNALTVLPTFHADDSHPLLAGGNCLIRPEWDKYAVKKSKKKNSDGSVDEIRTLTITLPDDWRRF